VLQLREKKLATVRLAVDDEVRFGSGSGSVDRTVGIREQMLALNRPIFDQFIGALTW